MSGTLILVVGPSGVGKDTLLMGAAGSLSDSDDFYFAKRHITRPKDAGGEDHIEISLRDYYAAEAAGAFPLHWKAHHTHYGVHKDELTSLERGQNVILNGSRSVLDHARLKFPNLAIVSITAPEPLLRERLIARGRETVDQIEKRVQRASEFEVSGDDVFEICNDGTVEEGILQMVAIFKRIGSVVA